jgi:hypothetical protein
MLKPFTKNDWHAFAGCESANPEIGSIGNTESVLILDGKSVAVLDMSDFSGTSIVVDYATEELARENALKLQAILEQGTVCFT